MKDRTNSHRKIVIHDQEICQARRIKIASLWVLILIAALATSLWIGSISDAKASEANKDSGISKIWSEIINGKSLDHAMQSAGFATKAGNVPDWAWEIGSEDTLERAYIDNESGIIELISEADLITATTNIRSELSSHGWAELSTEDTSMTKGTDLTNTHNRPNKSSNMQDTDVSNEGYVTSFMKEKGVCRWLTMECAKSANKTIVVLHIERT